MVSTLNPSAAKALWLLAPLWIFQGCALVRTQSHSAQDDLAVYATSETPARAGPEVSPPSGSTTADGPFSAERQANAYVHVVRWNGETLSLISLWYTGSWQNWKVIAVANPGIDPERIRIGDKIRIPESLLKKREPLALDWVSPPPERSPPTTTRGVSVPTAEEEEIDLSGPAEAPGSFVPEPPEESGEPYPPENPEEPEPGPYLTPETPGEAELLASLSEEQASTLRHPLKTETRPYVHVVRWEGETLSLIALWYTGSWQNWRVIEKANPGIDPNRITVGYRIRVPQGLLIRRDPLPSNFLPPSPADRTTPASAGREPPPVGVEIDLFGPVEKAAHREPTPKDIELFNPAEIAGKPAKPQ